MSKKIRLGNLGGIDLDQILFWKRLPTISGAQWLKAEYCTLVLYIPGSTIVVMQKNIPGEPVNVTKGINTDNAVVLEKEDFNKFVQSLNKEFPSDIPEDSNLPEEA